MCRLPSTQDFLISKTCQRELLTDHHRRPFGLFDLEPRRPTCPSPSFLFGLHFHLDPACNLICAFFSNRLLSRSAHTCRADSLPDLPSQAAFRCHLSILEGKQHLVLDGAKQPNCDVEIEKALRTQVSSVASVFITG